MLAGAAGSAPGVRTASWWVPLSKIAATASPPSGRTAPAGFCDAGGDWAARAGSIVGGALFSGFDEQPAPPATDASNSSEPTMLRRTGRLSYLCSRSNYFPSRKEEQSQILRNGFASNMAMLPTSSLTGEVSSGHDRHR